MSAFIGEKNQGFLVLTDYYNGSTVLIPASCITLIMDDDNADKSTTLWLKGEPRKRGDKVYSFRVRESITCIMKLLSLLS